MCTYFSKPWAVSLDTGVCGERSIKDLQPTTPVLKAWHSVSCSSVCVLCVVCLKCVAIVWFVEVRVLGFL